MNVKAYLLRGLGFLVAFLLAVSVLAQCQQQDYIALRALYLSTDGDNWTDTTGWPNVDFFNTNPTLPNGINMNNWYGITVSNGCVTSVYLDNNYLIGNLPVEIGNLTNLTNLYLHNNELIGEIPEEIGNLTNLINLYLRNNNLSGDIPVGIGNLTNLTNLLLSYNNLSGNIPVDIGNLTNLEHLSLSKNGLSGDIPEEIGNLTNLSLLSLYSNGLSGNISVALGNLTNLEVLRLYDNQLCGCYDSSLINLCNQLDSIYNNNGDTLVVNNNGEVSDGNNLVAPWEDFCANQSGLCPTTLTISTTTNPDCDNNNGSIELIPPITSCSPYTYTWDNAPNVQNPTGLSAGIYNFTVSDGQGSMGTGSVTLELLIPPVINLGEDRETCLPPDLTISTGYPNSTWSTGDTGATLPVNDFGTYSVTVTDNDCTAEADILFSQKQIILDINPAADIEIAPGEYIDITLYGADNYTWSPLDGLDFTNPAYVRAQPETTTLYTIFATTNEGCETTATLRVSISLLPGVFDPTNGTLSLDIDEYENNELSIYNRWGVRVFHANPYLTTNEWDGTYNGKLVPKGNYYAVLELEVSEIGAEKKRMFIAY